MWLRSRKHKSKEIDPDEIFIDSANIADFDRDQFEGRIEQPLSERSFVAAGAVLGILALLLLGRAGNLQLIQGTAFAKQAAENQLEHKVLFADRGVIEDRMGRALAWNERTSAEMEEDGGQDFAARVYALYRGIGHTVGYVKEPAKDSAGFYYSDTYVGLDGAEKVYDERLRGENGLTLSESDARGKIVSEARIAPPKTGEKIRLSIDAVVSQALYDAVGGRVRESGAVGGAGVIMDVRTGELLAMVSYPEYAPSKMVEGNKQVIAGYNADRQRPFLNRATDGLYSPGSIIKPMMAAAAIQEKVIDEYTKILSTGRLVLPNPYNPEAPTIFRDWRVNGWTDAREAIAVSSDIYFYEVGGGFEDQKGLGITRIDDYLQRFGFGEDAGLTGFSEVSGIIPTPEWKKKTFPDDPEWRLGNTYHTSIGQYGTLVTPLQAVRMTAAIANNGMLLTPQLVASSTPQFEKINVDSYPLQVAREGMRLSVTWGVARAVEFSFVSVAAKTGTAQVGVRNEFHNAWMVGFWPYETPKYAFAVVLERMGAEVQVGGSGVMHDFFISMRNVAPDYLQ